jgi:two-component system, LytTR family, response regulator
MISVIIVEDELHILKYMQNILESYDIFQIKGTFSDPDKALSEFTNINPDCVFLDIEMPRLNGIELAREFQKIKKDIYIVFTTAYSQYAVQAFEVEAIDYLMKPISSKAISRSIKRIERTLANKLSSNHEVEKKSDIPVKCFGTFDVRDTKGEHVKWPTKKAEEVFAYFICHQGECISKWRLIDLFWPDINEEKGLNNLYNTIYRIKNVINQLDYSPQIKKINDGYVLEAKEPLSDIKYLSKLSKMKFDEIYISKASKFLLSYNTPMFSLKDYMWHLSIEKDVNQLVAKICNQLINHYKNENDLLSADKIIKHYTLQHLEDEVMMQNWLEIILNWKDKQKEMEYRDWFNKLLIAVELPILT